MNPMLPTPRWKLRQKIRKQWEERITVLEDGLKVQRRMAGEFIDAKNFNALAAMHLTIVQDEEEIAILHGKLDLLNDDSSFEKAYEQTQESDGMPPCGNG